MLKKEFKKICKLLLQSAKRSSPGVWLENLEIVSAEDKDGFNEDDHSDFWSATDDIFNDELGYYPKMWAGIASTDFQDGKISILLCACVDKKGAVKILVSAVFNTHATSREYLGNISELDSFVVKAKKYLKVAPGEKGKE